MKQPANKTKYLAACLLLQAFMLIIFSSCSKDLKLPASGQKKKIVLLGELVAGDSITIRGAQSLTLSTSNSKFELPSGLSMSMKNGLNNIFLTGLPDSLSSLIYSIPFKSEERIASGSTYTVTATHSLMETATAEVRIPAPFNARIHDSGSATYNSAPAYRISIDIEDRPGEKNYYVIEAVKQRFDLIPIFIPDTPFNTIEFDTTYQERYIRQTIYSNDPASENVIMGTASRLSRRILFKDSSFFDGGNYRIDVYIPTLPPVSPDSFFSQSGPYRTILFVKSISKEYYDFLKTYEQYEPLSGFNTTGAPVRIDGNVKGGLGMIGGAYRRRFDFFIEQLL